MADKSAIDWTDHTFAPWLAPTQHSCHRTQSSRLRADYEAKTGGGAARHGKNKPRLTPLDCVSQLNWCHPAACNLLIHLRRLMSQTDSTLIGTLLCMR